MSVTDLALPADAAVLDATADPGAFIVAALDRAKAWLAQATVTSLPDVVEQKHRAEAIRCYMAQKELGHDAELSATEIVRRAERRIGELIREGQAAGEIRSRGEHVGNQYTGNQHSVGRNGGGASSKPSPSDFAPRHDLSSSNGGIYDMADNVTEEEFEKAIEQGKAEDNLSRANVIRKIKGKKRDEMIERTRGSADDPTRLARIAELAATGHTSKQIAAEIGNTDHYIRELARRHGIDIHADAITGKRRAIDSDRIVTHLVNQADALTAGLDLIDYQALDRDQLDQWVSSLSASIRSLTTVRNHINKELTRDQ